MPGPRANFVCLSVKCRQDDGGSPTYELPVSAKRCPVCGSKRVQRLFDAINVSSGHARKVDAIVEPAYTDAMAMKDESRAARREQRAIPPLAVPITRGQIDFANSAAGRQYPQLAALGGMQFSPDKAKPLAVPPTVVGQQIHGRPPVPDPRRSLRDTEYGIRNGEAVKL